MNRTPNTYGQVWRGRTADITYRGMRCIGKVIHLTEALLTFNIIIKIKDPEQDPGKEDYWMAGHIYTVTVEELRLRTLSEGQRQSLSQVSPKVIVGDRGIK